MMKYSDDTLEALQRAGCTMIFFGAESGNNELLKEMNKDLRAEDTLELASRIRRFGIIPEFSVIFGNPKDPEGDTRECIVFIRQLKRLNPDAEIIVEHYTPVPQRARMYGDVEDQMHFPTTPDEWATDQWQRFATQKDPQTPWLRPTTKQLIDNFELVVSSRWPTVQDIRLPELGATGSEGDEQLALPARRLHGAPGAEVDAAGHRIAEAEGREFVNSGSRLESQSSIGAPG